MLRCHFAQYSLILYYKRLLNFYFAACFVRRYKTGKHVTESKVHEVINDSYVSARKRAQRQQKKRTALEETVSNK